MKISFLVTYYNQKEYVRQSLDSILRIEKPCDWELLVGDDGSSDGTVEVVKEYMKQYPDHIFLHVMDREPGKKYEIVRRSSANRLNLIDHMTGDCFCILDGDDHYCHAGFICQALDLFHKDPSLSIIAFGYHMFSDKAGVLSSHTLSTGPVDTTAYIRTGMYTHAGACVFKNFMTAQRKAFMQELAYYDDNDIVINNLNFGTMYGVSQVVYSYRQTDISTYNAMNFAERAVLNSQGYDVDIQLITTHKEALLERYHLSLLWTFFLRRKLKKLLGKEKWERYLQGCQQLKGSLTYTLLNPSNKNSAEKARVRNTIFQIIKMHPKTAARAFLTCLKY